MINVPIGGNTFSNHKIGPNLVGPAGIHGWSNSDDIFVAYVYFDLPGIIILEAEMSATGQDVVCEVRISETFRTCTIHRGSSLFYSFGEWKIEEPGYVPIVLRILSGNTEASLDVSIIRITGSAVDAKTVFVPAGVDFNYGRRGASIYLGYPLPEHINPQSVYCEVAVPTGSDSIGTYACALRWSHGYTGIQVLSNKERVIIFSVWNPDPNDNYHDVVQDRRVTEIKHGEGVIIQPFGEEGSGLQCLYRYDWKANTNYRFLIRSQADGSDHTIFSTYFFLPENETWKLIACLRCPVPTFYLKGLSSFLENFYPNYGDISHESVHKNQWIYSASGEWLELVDAVFDPTPEHNYRLDYDWGVKDRGFYLKTGGFFKGSSIPLTTFSRARTAIPPNINFYLLESCSDQSKM